MQTLPWLRKKVHNWTWIGIHRGNCTAWTIYHGPRLPLFSFLKSGIFVAKINLSNISKFLEYLHHNTAIQKYSQTLQRHTVRMFLLSLIPKRAAYFSSISYSILYVNIQIQYNIFRVQSITKFPTALEWLRLAMTNCRCGHQWWPLKWFNWIIKH